MIDTHQHLLYPSRFSYPWAADLPALQNAFELDRYHTEATDGSITGTLFMEVDVDESQSASEAQFFCELGDDPASKIIGVIAAARPEHSSFHSSLDAIAHPKLRGIRRVLHTQPDALSQTSQFRKNVEHLGERGLTFDLCVLERQLPVAIELVDACPNTQFILDHCGVPAIAANSSEFWQARIREMARRPNVACKVSGIILYAGENQRSASELFPWFAHVVETFGWDRIVWGSDWPVCTLAVPLCEWVSVTHELLDLASATVEQRHAFLEANARRIYGV